VRITVMWTAATQNCTINLVWGAHTLLNYAATANTDGKIVIEVARNDGTSTHTSARIENTIDGTPATVNSSKLTPTDDTSADILIDFRGSVTAGGTLTYGHILIEHVP
jgi:hypothetical protein